MLQARRWWSPTVCTPTNLRCALSPQAPATRFSLFPLSLPALASPGEEVELWGLLGEILGWGMTCIYLTGRIPQILLNVTRGSVQGLSWPMFLMALGGNATYMGSILVRSSDWTRVKPNLPWLLDSAGCLLMDCLVSASQTHLHRGTLVGIIFTWGKGRMCCYGVRCSFTLVLRSSPSGSTATTWATERGGGGSERVRSGKSKRGRGAGLAYT